MLWWSRLHRTAVPTPKSTHIPSLQNLAMLRKHVLCLLGIVACLWMYSSMLRATNATCRAPLPVWTTGMPCKDHQKPARSNLSGGRMPAMGCVTILPVNATY